MSEVIVAPEMRDLESLGQQLATWLAGNLAGATDIRIGNLAYPRGAGMSHETILFDASWRQGAEHHEQGCVVRIKPRWHTVYPDDLFVQQYRLLQVLHEEGRVRVARPMGIEMDPALLGAPFFLMEKMIGRVAVSMPPYVETGWVAEATPAQRAKMWRNGVQQLAMVQKTPREKLDFLRGDTPGAEEGLAQEWDKYVRFAAWVSSDRPWPMLNMALDRLRARWPANQPAGLVWGDARIGNMMFDENFEVVGVMDWEQPSLGGALHDLAWWIVLTEMMYTRAGLDHFEGMGTREDTLALWHELTGISTDDIEWYEDFTKLKVACLSIRTTSLRNQPLPDDAWLAKRLNIEWPVS